MSNQSDNQKSPLIDFLRILGIILAVPIALFGIINNIFQQPTISLIVAIVTGIILSIWLALFRKGNISYILIAWLSLTVIILGIFVILSPIKTTTLKGNVVDAKGQAVANETVKVFAFTGQVYQTQTDSNGSYQFLYVPTGKYRIQVRSTEIQVDTDKYLIITLSDATTTNSPTITPTLAVVPATQAPAATVASAVVKTPTGYVIPPVKCAPTCTYKDMVVGFIQVGSEPNWRLANTASFKDTAAQLGITLKFYDGQESIETQIAAIRQINLDPTVNVIILAPVDNSSFDNVLKESKAAGKLVVLEDRSTDSSPDLYYTHIGPDLVAEGQRGATAMCNLLANSSKKNVVEISGTVDAGTAIDRGKGFREKMGNCGITITNSQVGGWNTSDTKAVMATLLKNTHDIQGVFAHNDQMAIGAIQAIKEAGLVPGKDIQVVGIDATADGFQYLISGELGADIECNPMLAPQVYEAALKGLNRDTSLPIYIPSQESDFFATQGSDALKAILAPRLY